MKFIDGIQPPLGIFGDLLLEKGKTWYSDGIIKRPINPKVLWVSAYQKRTYEQAKYFQYEQTDLDASFERFEKEIEVDPVGDGAGSDGSSGLPHETTQKNLYQAGTHISLKNLFAKKK